MRNSLGQIRRSTLDEIRSIIPNGSRLSVLDYSEDYINAVGKKTTKVLCLCSCGATTKVIASQLKVILSCGCLLSDKTRKRCQRFFPVIKSLHHRYNAMINRCYNPKNPGYKNYGGRGVTVCDEWRNNYQCFLDWSLANGWKPNLHLDKDSGTGVLEYSPNTCKWVTRIYNANKTRKNLMFDYKGETMSLAEICRKEQVAYRLVYDRVTQLGKPLEEAILTGRYKSGKKADGTPVFINPKYYHVSDNDRHKVYAKYGGKCAYSGKDLDKTWQIDHIEPLRSKIFLLVGDDGKLLNNKNDPHNMVPTMRILNHYKRAKNLEEWREYLLTLHIRLSKLPKKTVSSFTIKRKEYLLKVAACFGITAETPFSGKFYFETLEIEYQ